MMEDYRQAHAGEKNDAKSMMDLLRQTTMKIVQKISYEKKHSQMFSLSTLDKFC